MSQATESIGSPSSQPSATPPAASLVREIARRSQQAGVAE